MKPSLTVASLAGLVILGANFVLLTGLQAQTLYRCGNSYQDKPCAPGQSGKIIKKDMGSGEASVAASDAQCARRGEAAQKIVWAREAGALEAQQLEKAQSDDERDLISQVYAQRATAPEMKRMVEAKCIKDKQLAQTGKGPSSPVNKAPGQLNPGASKAGNANGANKSGNDKANRDLDDDDEGDGAKKVVLSAADKKKAQCDQLRKSIQENISLQRKGGGPEEMDALNHQRRELNSQFFKADC